MYSFTKSLIAVFGALVLCAPMAGAATDEDVAAQLQAMQERMLQLEDKLDAAEDKLDVANERIGQQEALIEESGIGSASSGLSEFVDTIEVGGWIAGSYFYNTRGSDGRDNLNQLSGVPAIYPFHPDDNSFSLDQLWFELERPVNEENRAGFRADIVYGKTAGILSGNLGPASGGDGFSGNDLDVYQMYIQYLAPVGNGIHFNFGKFGTLIGAEVVQSPYNFNITRGNVYQLFQPFTHTGITASTDVGPASVTLGLVNETRSFPAADVDPNNDKAFIWSAAWSNEDSGVGFSFAGITGAADTGAATDTPAGDRETILDFILSFDPNENFSGYVNADWIRTENSVAGGPGDTEGYGIAAAGRVALNDRTGFALRGEWIDLDPDDADRTRIWGLTGTVDYRLTEKLMVRGEVRYDNGIGSADEIFFARGESTLGVPQSGQNPVKDDQLVVGVEAIYSF